MDALGDGSMEMDELTSDGWLERWVDEQKVMRTLRTTWMDG